MLMRLATLLFLLFAHQAIAEDCLKLSLAKSGFHLSRQSTSELKGASNSLYKTKMMKLHYWGERIGLKYGTFVKRFNKKKLEDLEVFVKDGLLVNRKGEPLTMYDGLYTMDRRGHIYAYPTEERGVIHHSTLARGNPVSSAGHLTIENGKLTAVNNFSGHYSPKKMHLDQIENELTLRGADLFETTFKDFWYLTNGL